MHAREDIFYYFPSAIINHWDKQMGKKLCSTFTAPDFTVNVCTVIYCIQAALNMNCNHL